MIIQPHPEHGIMVTFKLVPSIVCANFTVVYGVVGDRCIDKNLGCLERPLIKGQEEEQMC